jgi:hypothetical protein
MVSEGKWEITNHGFNHTRMNYVHLQRKIYQGQNKVYGWFAHTFLYGSEITIGNDIYHVNSLGTDSIGIYFTVNEPFISDYEITTPIQLSDAYLEQECFSGVEELEIFLNTKIKHFTWPFTGNDQRSINKVKEKYLSARAYNGELSDGSKNNDNPGCNIFPFTNLYTLNSAYLLENYTETEISQVLQKAVENNYVVIQFSHTNTVVFSKEKLRYLISECFNKNIEITTRSKLWEYYEL